MIGRIFKNVIFIMVIALILSACSSKSSSTSNTATPADTSSSSTNGGSEQKKEKPVNLTLMIGRPNEVPIMKQLAKDFNAKFPHVTIDVQAAGNADKDITAYVTLLKTQLISGSPPDILEGDVVGDMYRTNAFEPLDAYLDQPNEYIEGNQKWSDAFVNGALGQYRQADGKIYNFAMDTWSSGFFYNKSILAKAGIASPPTTWSEMLDQAKKIQAAGYIPFATSNDGIGGGWGIVWTWEENTLLDSIYRNDIGSLDGNGNGLVERAEVFQAYADGKLDPTSDKYKTTFKTFKDWSQYWNKDWASSTGDKIQKMWYDGKVAYTSAGSWMYADSVKNISQLPDDKKFEFGVTAFPNFDDSSGSGYASPSAFTGSPGPGLTVNAKIDDDKKKWAITFLKYVTSPYGMKVMLTAPNSAFGIPLVNFTDKVGVELSATSKLFADNVIKGHPLIRIADGSWSGVQPEGQTKWISIMQKYILDKTTLNEAAQQWKDYIVPIAKQQLAK